MSSPSRPPTPEPGPETTDRPGNDAVETHRPLKDLVAEVDSPGVLRSDIDALIAELRRTPPFADPLQDRVDVLRKLVARDHPVADHVGQDGTTVRQAAVAAWLALGLPAEQDVPAEQDIPPEAMDAAPVPTSALAPSPAPSARRSPGSQEFLIATGCTLYQSFAAFWAHQLFPFFRMDFSDLLSAGVLIPLLLVWGPPLLGMLGHSEKSRSLQVLGSVAMWLQVVTWVLVGLLFSMGSIVFLFFLAPWHLAAWAAIVLRPVKPPEPAPSPTP